MNIIGIHNTGTISSAALLQNGSLVFAAAEERFTRHKHSKYFPHAAIDQALDHASLSREEIDHYAIAWNPAINIGRRYRAGLSEWPAHPGERFYSNPNHLLPRLGLDALTHTQQTFFSDHGKPVSIDYITHHLAHCANAFYLSGFEDAAILSCDGYGEIDSIVFAKGTRNNGIEVLKRWEFPNSLGAFYSAITHVLGMRPDSDEWKVMGAGAYGDPARYRKQMKNLVLADSENIFRLNLDYFNHFDFDSPGLLSPRGLALLDIATPVNGVLEQQHYDLAAAAQERLEHVLLELLLSLKRATGYSSVCLTGGVMMNCLFNGKAVTSRIFDHVFIPYAPDDSGNSIGAALWLANKKGMQFAPSAELADPYLGNFLNDSHIEATLESSGYRYRKLEDPAKEAALALYQNGIVGWVQGRMEFGQRALGNRSILANPTDKNVKARVNSAIKFREPFRPFAPAVSEGYEDLYFCLNGSENCRYMELAVPVKDRLRTEAPGVCHADNTARVQIVRKNENKLFYSLINQFRELSGTPVVLNTSFNQSGEPIVASVEDAIRCFATSGMTHLFINNYMVSK